MNCQYEQLFFENCFDLKTFYNDIETNYYQVFIRNYFDDPIQMKYEMQNTYYKPVEMDLTKMIMYIRKRASIYDE
jgi:hypothetical protein